MKRLGITGLCRKMGVAVVALVCGGFAVSAQANQQDTNRLNMLSYLQTPSKSDQGQGFVGARFAYLNGDVEDSGFDSAWSLRFEGEYAFTNELVLRVQLPDIRSAEAGNNDNTGLADMRVGAQYKLNGLLNVNPAQAVLAAQVIIAFPTSDDDEPVDKSEFQIEPLLLAYKDLGAMGPGTLGLYGQIGANLSSGNSSFMLGGGGDYNFGNGFHATAELVFDLGIATNISFIPGVTYTGLQSTQLGFGLPIGFADAPTIGFVVYGNWGW